MIYYVCPNCKRPTAGMTLVEGKIRRPTELEKQKRPGMEHIAHELLNCPCGLTNTWYTVEERCKSAFKP